MVTPKTEQRTLYLTHWSYDEDAQRFDELVCELDGYPGWRILPDVVVTERGLLLRRLVIEPDNGMPEQGITTRMLRAMRTGDLLKALRVAARQSAQIFGDSPDVSVTKRVGRRGRDDRYYATWGAAYVEALARSPRPVDELAARHDLSASQVRNLIHACRMRGMLTAAPSGRAGGELTRKALELLEEG